MTYLYLILFVVVCLVYSWPNFWQSRIRGKLTLNMATSAKNVHIDDIVIINVEIHNPTWMPCPLVHITLQLPDGLVGAVNGSKEIGYTTFLWMRQRVKAQFHLRATARGHHRINAITLQMNEGLGLCNYVQTFYEYAGVSVMPTLVMAPQIKRTIQAISGDIEVERWLHPDESLLKGIRPYQSSDLMKHIAWKSTARTGQLMSKQFSSSTESNILLVLNAQYNDPYWLGANPSVFDEMCALTATYAKALAEQRMGLTFLTNASISREPKRQWYGKQTAHGIRLLLARAMPVANGSLEQLLRTLLIQTSTQSSIFLFTSFLTLSQRRLLQQILKSGRLIHLITPPQSDISPALLAGFSVQQTSRVDGMVVHGRATDG